MVGGESEYGLRQLLLHRSTVLLRGVDKGKFRNDTDGTKKAGSLMNLNHTISDLAPFYPSLSFWNKKEEL